MHQELSRYRYCTTFVIEGEDLDARALETELERLGDSLLVVGDPSALKVHVHTDDPGAALSLGTRAGTIEGVEIADMHRQTEEREERLLAALPGGASRSAVVAVVAGEGNRRLFEDLGAEQIVEGGQTMNPSTADLLAADRRQRRRRGRAAAEQLERRDERRAGRARGGEAGARGADDVDPGGPGGTGRVPHERSADENAAAMLEALAGVVTGEIAVASRDASANGVAGAGGEFLALLDGHAVAAGAGFDEVARELLERLLAQPRDVLTLLRGEGAPPLNGLLEELAERHPELELDVHEGGQPHYPLLLSAE